MRAMGDEEALYLLEFVEEGRSQIAQKTTIIPGRTKPLDLIENELRRYFEGKLITFTTPLFLRGSPFQKRVWEELRKIPFGETRSYAHIAAAMEKPTAFRAVAQANGANQLAIVIPCHRVINKSGALGGYAGGVTRKQWLLNHEI